MGPKWDNFLILAPMILIELQGDSKLINESGESFLYPDSFRFDQKLEETDISTNRVNWNHLGPKWDNFLILAPMILIQL